MSSLSGEFMHGNKWRRSPRAPQRLYSPVSGLQESDVVRIRVFDWIYLIGRHANESPTSYSCFPGHLNQVRMRSYVPVIIDDCSIVLNGTKILLLLKTLKY